MSGMRRPRHRQRWPLREPSRLANAGDGSSEPWLARWLLASRSALLALLLVALGGLAVWSSTPTPSRQPGRVTRLSALLPPDVSPGPPDYRVAVSPDGTRLAYAATDQLYLRRMDQAAFTPVRGTDGARGPFFSPNGEWVAFWADRQLKKVEVSGGAPVTLATVNGYYGASWDTDDTIFFSMSGTGIARVPGTGGAPEIVVPLAAGDFGLVRPQRLPGGEWILFSLYPGNQVAIQSLVTGERRVLLEEGADARYVATGHLVYAVDGTLFAVPFDARTQTVTPGAVSLVEGVREELSRLVQFDVSRDGSLVFLPAAGVAPSTLGWVDRDGQMTPVTRGEYRYLRLSPDARYVAAVVAGDVWLYDLERDAPTRLTDQGGSYPLWTPDGSRLLFSSNRTGLFGVYSKEVDGSGEAEPVVESTNSLFPGSWSPDGETFAFYEVVTDANRDIWVHRNGEASTFLSTEFNERVPRVSPDGRWVAYVSDRSGEDRVYVQPFPQGGAVTSISTGVGTEPVWSRDGSELFFRDRDRMLAVTVDAADGTSFRAARPRLLFEVPYDFDRLGNGNTTYDTGPDGRFLMVQTADETGADASQEIRVIINWDQELLERVPIP